MTNYKIKVGISVGDIHGIGIEIIINALTKSDLLNKCTPVIFCSHEIFRDYLKLINVLDSEINFIDKANLILENRINVFQTEKFKHKIELGKPSKDAAYIAFKSLETSCFQLKNQKIDVLVTAPIDKYQIRKSISNFIGHTEYLENQFEGKSLMVMLSEKMKIAFITGHIPLKKVAESINKEKIINKTIQLNDSLKRDFGITKPKIAVLGLNPHAGENDMLGMEESDVISPAVLHLKTKENILADGPFSADSFFTEEKLKKYDGIIAMYHDQGLIPFKGLSFSSGVNYTAGLNAIRTSPVHGVAYDISGQNNADSDSFTAAIDSACNIYISRNS